MSTQLIGAPVVCNAFERYPFNGHSQDNGENHFSATTFKWDTDPLEHEVAAVAPTSGAEMKARVTPDQNSLVSMMKAAKAVKGPGKRKRRPSPPKKTTELPKDFVPSNYSVLCGKGSENYNAVGKFS